ncbi:DUF559 domain-containing protein [Microlunatus elymi]|uniref:DUF559 domain-containing protein n=1 Tax=Microlunatus elymi TaxID=2596828 RepID=A0A516Q0P9_9ACTN|nr:DUF559 domain-containing protein [Microlunatus elymi]QDP96781.1 DUF559 domain-containing protein [Microlunatus elymi]
MSDEDLSGPAYRRVLHGVYVTSAVQNNLRERARAALHVAAPGAYVSHHTAASIWGGITPSESRIHITVPADGYRNQRRGVVVHQYRELDADVRTVAKIRISSPAQCFCELATNGLSLVDLAVLGDSLVAAEVVTSDELIKMADSWPGRGARTASRAARMVRAGTDSPPESKLRMLIVLAGLPEPVVNYIIRHENGDWKLRFDLCYPELMILVEYDGEHHNTDPRQWARDLERREYLERLGWRIIVIQKNHLYQAPEQVVTRIRQALLDRGLPSSRCRIRPRWMTEFAA